MSSSKTTFPTSTWSSGSSPAGSITCNELAGCFGRGVPAGANQQRKDMRLFIAIQLNDEMKEALAGLQQRMRDQGVQGNFTRWENLHLTLAFIGEYPDPEEVKDVLETVRFEPFPISLDGMGSFGNLWWAGLDGSDALRSLAKGLRRALAEAGIPFDRKKFSPHITLVRKAYCRGRAIPEEVLREPPRGGMVVDHFSLMRSDRGKHGMIYTEL